MTALPPYDAVVLAGGSARRLGGRDKPALTVGGRRLLDRVLDALAAAGRVVVVGPDRGGLPAGVVRTREEPPGGGPVAGLAAGLPLVGAGLVAVLAADLPFLTAGVVDALRSAPAPDDDGALLVDAGGQPQWLAGVWRAAPLRAALAAAGPPAGVSARRLLGGLTARRVTVGAVGSAPPWWDVDTDDDLTTAEELA